MKKIIMTLAIVFAVFAIQAQNISDIGKEIKFGQKSDKLFPSSNNVLDKLVIKLGTDTTLHLRVIGYADAYIGNARYNSSLAQKRAETVKAYLAAKGIADSRIVAQGQDYSNEEELEKLKQRTDEQQIEIVEIKDKE